MWRRMRDAERFDAAAQALGDLRRLRRLGARQDHREFLAAVARDQRAFAAHASGDRGRDLLQATIAGAMVGVLLGHNTRDDQVINTFATSKQPGTLTAQLLGSPAADMPPPASAPGRMKRVTPTGLAYPTHSSRRAAPSGFSLRPLRPPQTCSNEQW